MKRLWIFYRHNRLLSSLLKEQNLLFWAKNAPSNGKLLEGAF